MSIFPSSNKVFKDTESPYAVYGNVLFPHSIFYNKEYKSVQELFINKFNFKFQYLLHLSTIIKISGSDKVLLIFYHYYGMSLYNIFITLRNDYCLIF